MKGENVHFGLPVLMKGENVHFGLPVLMKGENVHRSTGWDLQHSHTATFSKAFPSLPSFLLAQGRDSPVDRHICVPPPHILVMRLRPFLFPNPSPAASPIKCVCAQSAVFASFRTHELEPSGLLWKSIFPARILEWVTVTSSR